MICTGPWPGQNVSTDTKMETKLTLKLTWCCCSEFIIFCIQRTNCELLHWVQLG